MTFITFCIEIIVSAWFQQKNYIYWLMEQLRVSAFIKSLSFEHNCIANAYN
jgi:hypothetical protein